MVVYIVTEEQTCVGTLARRTSKTGQTLAGVDVAKLNYKKRLYILWSIVLHLCYVTGG